MFKSIEIRNVVGVRQIGGFVIGCSAIGRLVLA